MTQGRRWRQRIKVVMEEVGTGGLMGVQALDCDPHITVVPDCDIDAALARVPELLQAAHARWDAAPRFPQYQRPPEEAKPAASAPKSAPKSTPPQAKRTEPVRERLL